MPTSESAASISESALGLGDISFSWELRRCPILHALNGEYVKFSTLDSSPNFMP